MIKPNIWKDVPLMWGKIPEQYLHGKKLEKLIQAYIHRTIELAVSYDEEIHWRRFIDNATLELGL